MYLCATPVVAISSTYNSTEPRRLLICSTRSIAYILVTAVVVFPGCMADVCVCVCNAQLPLI